VTVLTGSCSAEIEADIERCWAVVQDIARAPQWQRTLVRVDVVERDDQGRPLICDTLSDAHLTKVQCRVQVTYDPPHRLSWHRVQSEDLDAMEGSWELEDLGQGRTRATYALAVDPGRVGFLARPIERLIRPLVIGHQAEELAGEVSRGG
jgi:hypothetical protein